MIPWFSWFCFRDLYIFFQQKTPPERFVSLSSFISIKIFQIHPELGSQQSNFQHLSALQFMQERQWMAFLVSWTVTYCYTNWLLALLWIIGLSHSLSELLPMLRWFDNWWSCTFPSDKSTLTHTHMVFQVCGSLGEETSLDVAECLHNLEMD